VKLLATVETIKESWLSVSTKNVLLKIWQALEITTSFLESRATVCGWLAI
jgi:hypothetical protein